MTTRTLLGELRTEAADGMHRPAGVGVRNDGFRSHWMAPGQSFSLAHDGTGWRVTSPSWTDGHILRLVDAVDGRALVGALPTAQGVVDMGAGVYELVPVDGGWSVYQH
jgi:hypothetical protein